METNDHDQLSPVVAALQQQVRDAQRLACLGSLASSVAHEFNNILTTIINSAKWGLLKQSDADRVKALERVLVAGKRAAEITSSMLSYARNRSNDRRPADIVQLVEESLTLVEKDLTSHQVRLEKQFDGRPQAIVAPGQIQQIFLNLAINARQAMPRGGMLRVGVRHNPTTNMVEVAITDTGIGIPRTQIKQIFDPYFTTKSGPDETGKGGTGLGLAVCREIIEAHRGRIHVESRVGQGTTFTVKLPAADESEQLVA